MAERNVDLDQLNSEISSFLEKKPPFFIFVKVEFDPKKTGSGDLTHSGPCQDVANFIRNELKKLFIIHINENLINQLPSKYSREDAMTLIVREAEGVERALRNQAYVNDFETSGGWIRERKISFYINLVLRKLNTTIKINFIITPYS